MRRWTSFEGHPQPTRGSGISLQPFHPPLLKAAHLSRATSFRAGQPSRCSVTSRVWPCPRGPSEFVPEVEQQERKPQALHTDRGSPHKAIPALVGISGAHPWPSGLWVPPSHLCTKDMPVSQGTRGVWGASSPPLPWPWGPSPLLVPTGDRPECHTWAQKKQQLLCRPLGCPASRDRLTVLWWEGLQDAPPPALSAIPGPPSLST